MDKKRKLLTAVACILLITAVLAGCGGGTVDNPAKLGSSTDFSSWFGPGKKLSKKEPGTYYFTLNSDIKLSSEGVIAGQNVVIDLNGHSITGEKNRAFAISDGGSLTLKNGTVQTAGADADGGVIYMNGAKGLELVDVNLTNTDDTQISEHLSGGVIYANAEEACAIHIYGNSTLQGSASGLRRNGGTVSINGQVAMYLHSGTVTGGTAGTSGNIHMDGRSALYLLGGTVENGTAVRTSEITGFGGNICVQSMGRIYMYGGTVTGGTAQTSGGNIYLSNTAAADGESGLYLYDGLISEGLAAADGGNLYAMESNSVLRFYGGTVENGDAMRGGNVFLQTARIEMYGGTLTGLDSFTTLVSGGNVCALQSDVILRGGRIEKGTAKESGGNLYVRDSSVEIYGGTVCNGAVASTAVTKGGGNLYAGGDSTVNMYGSEIYGGISNCLQDESASAAGGNVVIAGTTKMQMFGGTIRDGMVYGEITRGGGVYVYGQAAGNDSVFHMYGGTISNGPLENTMRGLCIGSYSETNGDAGHGIARIFAGDVIFTGDQNHPDRLHTIYGNKSNGRDVRIFDGTDYKGLYRHTTVGACPDATHNTVTGEVAATCLTHGYTEYTCGTCGVWCAITAQPTGHTEQTETLTTDEGVTCTRHTCTACDLTWMTQVDATAATEKKDN